jgi:phosphotransferase system enzyme I (PtsI)
VGARVLRILLQSEPHSIGDAPKGSIIVAHDLSPADAALLEPSRISGIITARGGGDGHTAIMARALSLPTVMGIPNLMTMIPEGAMLVIDGREGLVFVNPPARVLKKYEKLREEILTGRRDLKRIKLLPAVTADGTVISLGANLELPSEVNAARASGAENIGLLRTEFMFMNRSTLPDEEQQYDMLRHVVEGMEGRTVTIRTLDVGGEKIAAALQNRFADSPNPALGLRAIRLSLREPTLLITQFAAILRASAHGPVRIMLPMITTVAEVLEAKRLLNIAARRLKRRQVKMAEALPPVGVLIEVPGAALIADDLAKVSDFFAIGTNDLTQYTLAVDRADMQVASLYDPQHKGVEKLIRLTVEAAAAANIGVTVCGEMAGDARLTEKLIKLGVRHLSMAPTHLPAVKRNIRALKLA